MSQTSEKSHKLASTVINYSKNVTKYFQKSHYLVKKAETSEKSYKLVKNVTN